MNYKNFVSRLDDADHPGLTSPKKKKIKASLKQPSRARIAAQKKIQQARTQRLCSPPPPTQITTANTPDRTHSDLGNPIRVQMTISSATANLDQETNEAANTLLSLSANKAVGESMDTTESDLPEKPIKISDDTLRPPVAFEVNVITDPKDNSVKINPSQIIGSAVKEETSQDQKTNQTGIPDAGSSSKPSKAK